MAHNSPIVPARINGPLSLFINDVSLFGLRETAARDGRGGGAACTRAGKPCGPVLFSRHGSAAIQLVILHEASRSRRSALRLSQALDMLPGPEQNPTEHATYPRESERPYTDLLKQTVGIPGFHPAQRRVMYINNKDLSRVETRPFP
ncbi:hypothetical protein PUN28_002022 [Cardiocondyla obscurior]|uniref:Uncharacterized protein n=1 Tax=Cardiocondyla obscurior TaxID=286306 RepID=A0AAW2GSC1_9HYME